MKQLYYIFDGKKWDWMESDEDWAQKDIEEYNFELVTSAMTDEDKALAASKQSEKDLLAYLDFEYSGVRKRNKFGFCGIRTSDASFVARWRLQLYKEQKTALILADVFRVKFSDCFEHEERNKKVGHKYRYIQCQLTESDNIFECWGHEYIFNDKLYKQYSLRLDYGNWKYMAAPNRTRRIESNNNYYTVKHDWTESGFDFSVEIPQAVVARAMEFLKELAAEEFGFSPTVPDNMPGDKLLKYFVQYPMDVNVGLYVDMLGYDFGCQILRKNDSNFDLVCDYLELPKTKSLKKAYHANYAAMAICYFLSRKIGVDDINIWQYFLDGQKLLDNDIDIFGIDRTGNFYFKKERNGWWFREFDLLYAWLLDKWGAKRTGEILSDALLQPMNLEKEHCLFMWREDYLDDALPEAFVQAIYRYGISREAHDIRNELTLQADKERWAHKCSITFDLTEDELGREEETPEGAFKVARTGKDLFDISENMHNCVFRCYTKSMQRKDCTIYYLQQEDKYLACIEARDNRVVQAKGMCNGVLKGNLLETVASWCARHDLIYAPH